MKYQTDYLGRSPLEQIPDVDSTSTISTANKNSPAGEFLFANTPRIVYNKPILL